MKLEIYKIAPGGNRRIFETVKDEWNAERLIRKFLDDEGVMERIDRDVMDNLHLEPDECFDDGGGLTKAYLDEEDRVIQEDVLGDGNAFERLQNIIRYENGDYSCKLIEEEE